MVAIGDSDQLRGDLSLLFWRVGFALGASRLYGRRRVRLEGGERGLEGEEGGSW